MKLMAKIKLGQDVFVVPWKIADYIVTLHQENTSLATRINARNLNVGPSALPEPIIISRSDGLSSPQNRKLKPLIRRGPLDVKEDTS